MDSTKSVTHVSLCAGYGGIDLGLKRAIPNLRTVAFSEIEAFACANLVSKMEAGLLDAAPIWSDLKTFPWEEFHDRVGILSGGYPCQPFSSAGKRLGKDDPRHLWPFIADGISRMRPSLCFFENVEGHISLGLSTVVSDLEELGYKVAFGLFSASEVGAPHQRKRVFILAHRNDAGLERTISSRIVDSLGWKKPSYGHIRSSGHHGSELADSSNGRRREDRKSTEFWSNLSEQSSSDSRQNKQGEANERSCGLNQAMADTDSIGDTRSRNELGIVSQGGQGRSDTASDSDIGISFWPSRPGQSQYEWEPPRVVGHAAKHDRRHLSERNSAFGFEQPSRRQTEPALGGNIDGPAGGMDYAELCVSGDNRTDELRLLGNGVVPATAAIAFTTLMQEMFP